MSNRGLDRVLRELRERRGLTQEELAFKAKVTPGYLAHLSSAFVLTRRSMSFGVWRER